MNYLFLGTIQLYLTYYQLKMVRILMYFELMNNSGVFS